ncbi:hypothetical protein BAE44_0003731, partial [Dichanthelium oligosanthes]
LLVWSAHGCYVDDARHQPPNLGAIRAAKWRPVQRPRSGRQQHRGLLRACREVRTWTHLACTCAPMTRTRLRNLNMDVMTVACAVD